MGCGAKKLNGSKEFRCQGQKEKRKKKRTERKGKKKGKRGSGGKNEEEEGKSAVMGKIGLR